MTKRQRTTAQSSMCICTATPAYVYKCRSPESSWEGIESCEKDDASTSAAQEILQLLLHPDRLGFVFLLLLRRGGL